MSFRVVRESKFRNIFGTSWKREQCYDNIRVSKSSWDSTMCAVNPKFLAVIVESAGGGAFIVFPLNKTGRIPADFPLVGGHKGPVLDIAWCPHNDNVIASGSEDCLVRVWQIPDLPLSRTLTDPVVELDYHQRRVGLVLWHPSAQNVLLSVGSDNHIVIWNVGEGEILKIITCHPDIVYSACWNWDGSQIVTTCKDKKLRIINPRTGDIIEEGVCHEGTKASRAIFLRTGLIFTTGFSKMSERQYSLRSPEHLSEPIVMAELDTSNGMMFPMYDPDHNIVYLCGKGDSVFRYYEVTNQAPFVHYINMFPTSDPQRGIGMMPKRGLNVSICEIARFYRLNNSGYCQVISVSVPRKSERYQEDLYPDTPGDVAAMTAEEWFGGQNAEPLLISMSDVQQLQASSKKSDLKVPKKSYLLEKSSTATSQSSVDRGDGNPEPSTSSSSNASTSPTHSRKERYSRFTQERLNEVPMELNQTLQQSVSRNETLSGSPCERIYAVPMDLNQTHHQSASRNERYRPHRERIYGVSTESNQTHHQSVSRNERIHQSHRERINDVPMERNQTLYQQLNDQMRPFNEEIRKLKAIIVKHENRIRKLEAEYKIQEIQLADLREGAAANNNLGAERAAAENNPAEEVQRPHQELDPDEV